jgi:hypothetical protein
MITDTPQPIARHSPHRQRWTCRSICLTSAIVFLSACSDDGRSISPTAPTSTTPTSPSPAARYTLSGVVFEVMASGRRPIEGVSVYCDLCGGPLGHMLVHTDANGFFSLPETANGYVPLIVEKDGYGIAGGLTSGPQVGWITATVAGDTTFDLEMVRR